LERPNGAFQADPSRCFVSNGDGTFTERGAELGVADTGEGRGVVAFDYDRDGDLTCSSPTTSRRRASTATTAATRGTSCP